MAGACVYELLCRCRTSFTGSRAAGCEVSDSESGRQAGWLAGWSGVVGGGGGGDEEKVVGGGFGVMIIPMT